MVVVEQVFYWIVKERWKNLRDLCSLSKHLKKHWPLLLIIFDT